MQELKIELRGIKEELAKIRQIWKENLEFQKEHFKKMKTNFTIDLDPALKEVVEKELKEEVENGS